MDYEEAFAIAEKHFRDRGARGVAQANETPELFIFFGNGAPFGPQGIRICRATGEVDTFRLPDRENFAILSSSRLLFREGDKP